MQCKCNEQALRQTAGVAADELAACREKSELVELARAFKLIEVGPRSSTDAAAGASEEDGGAQSKKKTTTTRVCDECGERVALHKCSRCKRARYCSAECQREAWRGGHKAVCQATK